jgi:signal peptidase I
MAHSEDLRRRVVIAVGVALLLLLIGTLATEFPFQFVRNVGRAMEPSLGDRELLIVEKLTYWLRDPESGDVVIMRSPLDPSESFVRRVIAQEADTLQIIAGQVYINDQQVSDDQVPAEFGGQNHWGPAVIPSGFYFVLGDHRNESTDSRHWGFVPKRYIIGKIVV